jgi:hypothetical protein
MKITTLVILAITLPVVSACVVEEPYHHRSGYHVPTKVIVHTDGDSDDHHRGRFCPPGQAKKGNC